MYAFFYTVYTSLRNPLHLFHLREGSANCCKSETVRQMTGSWRSSVRQKLLHMNGYTIVTVEIKKADFGGVFLVSHQFRMPTSLCTTTIDMVIDSHVVPPWHLHNAFPLKSYASLCRQPPARTTSLATKTWSLTVFPPTNMTSWVCLNVRSNHCYCPWEWNPRLFWGGRLPIHLTFIKPNCCGLYGKVEETNSSFRHKVDKTEPNHSTGITSSNKTLQ